MEQVYSDAILAYLKEKGRPCTYQEIERGTKMNDTQDFFEAVEQLVSDGELMYTKTGNLVLPQDAGLHKAVIISQSPTFAFAKSDDFKEDIHISAEKINKAILGDTVWIGNIKKSKRGFSGDVVRVIKKSSHRFSGRVIRGKYKNEYCFESDSSFRMPIPISVKRNEKAPDVGSKVLVEVFCAYGSSLVARIVKTYGNANSAHVCADAIIDAKGIPHHFPRQVIIDAEREAEKSISADEIKKRLDLRDEVIFTIDGADAKDLDDAISIRKLDSGWILGVHIADVSHYVRSGTSIDNEAMRRGTSVYFADRVIPMLPVAISNGVCSLTADEDKLAFSALIGLNENGDILSYEFRKTVIRSKVRGVYDEINQLFSGDASDEIKQKYKSVLPSLKQGRKLAKLLKKNADKRGYVELDSRESRFVLDENGVCVDVFPRKSGEAEEMIEQFMITANCAAAKLAKREKLPFVYRVHEEPAAERIENLRELAGQIGIPAQEIKEGMKSETLRRLVNLASDTKFSAVFSKQVLRTMAKARYDTSPIGHYGLSLADYCHFTSPIRRYPDTSIHRILSDYVQGSTAEELRGKYASFASESANQSSECEIRAMTAERETERCYMAEWVRAHLDESFIGTVSGVCEWGIYVELENSVEGLIPSEYLPFAMEYDGYFSFRNGRDSLTIGDRITVKALYAEVFSGRIIFALESKAGDNKRR